MEYPGEGHVLGGAALAKDFLPRMENFLNKFVIDHE